jgi:Fusaric acid resistance protein-like
VAQPWWKPVWSVPAALRAVRATIVVPSLFALTDKVVGDPQMALFATFGGFATLVIAGFGGTRKDKFIAHAGLAVTGSLAIIIGTLVSGTTWLAVVVTVPVTFAIFFAGIAGPNAASGSAAAMFAYVLPVVSAGDASMIPSRLAGWWLASAAGTIAVLLLSPRPPGDKLRAATANLAAELASRLSAAADGVATDPESMRAAKEKLRTAFLAAPYRPSGLATADQALSSLVQLLEWGASQVGDAFDGHVDLTTNCAADRALLRGAAALFTDTHDLLTGQPADPDIAGLERAREDSAQQLRDLSGRVGEPDARMAAAQAVHAQGIAVTARAAVADAMVASRRADPETIAAERRKWYGPHDGLPEVTGGAQGVRGAQGDTGGGQPPVQGTTAPRAGSPSPRGSTVRGLLSGTAGTPRQVGLRRVTLLVTRHATVRSVWFLNSLRGALALAAAVAVADVSGVQHAFWVVLGTLSVLRTSAASTGGTAWRALAGTVVGFVVGALLLLAIGTGQTALWVALPVAVLVAAYAPGTTPFLVGQAAFTVTIVVLFNLLAPAGWRVGLLRIEDVAIGCAVSLVVGVLFWPRGVASVVGDDLADTFRRGAEYLSQAVDWALSELMLPPAAAVGAANASIRLDDAVRGFLTEQGSKKLSKEDLWTMVNASMRLRLTAHTLAGLRPDVTAPGLPPGGACLPLDGSEEYGDTPACVALRSEAGSLAGFYDQVADEVGRSSLSGLPAWSHWSTWAGRLAWSPRSARSPEPPLIPAPPLIGPAVPRALAAAGSGTAGSAAAGNGTAPAAGSGGADSPGGSGGPGTARGATAADRTAAAGAATAVDAAAPAPPPVHPHLLWVQEHLHHLSQSAQTVSAPAQRVAEARRRPWWR